MPTKCDCGSCAGTVTPRQRTAVSALLWSAATMWNAEAEDMTRRDSIAALAIADALTAIARKIDKGMSPDDAVNSVLAAVESLAAAAPGTVEDDIAAVMGEDVDPVVVVGASHA